jgi:hypothetical protein
VELMPMHSQVDEPEVDPKVVDAARKILKVNATVYTVMRYRTRSIRNPNRNRRYADIYVIRGQRLHRVTDVVHEVLKGEGFAYDDEIDAIRVPHATREAPEVVASKLGEALYGNARALHGELI